MLFEHQRKIIEEDPKRCGLFLGTGSGKTRTALMLAKGTILVICPKTQAEDKNWQREALDIGIHYLPCVISKETFRRDHATLPRFDTVIVDEAHTCLGVTPNTRWRNKTEIPKTSQLFEALEGYINRTRPERFYLATATIMKSPMTVWGAMKLLNTLPASIDMRHFLQFRNRFYTKLPMPGREVWVPKSDSATKDELAAIVKGLGYIGRLQDFFDVPDQTFKTDYIELTAKQKTRLKEIALEYPEPIVRLGKRHQIENGVLTGDEFTPPEYFENGKIDKILDYAEEFPQMVVFAKYTAQIGAIRRALERCNIPCLVLSGATVDRGALLAQAKVMPRCVFIAQSQISAGWELPEYPVMVFASCTYSFVDRSQAEGRILRANHLKKNLYIDMVVRNGIDEAVHKSLMNKRDFDEHMYIRDMVE